MSAGYAERLSEYRYKGECGLPEQQDTSRQLAFKLKQLAEWVKEARSIVALTGAGISTSAGIPDFRGPKGVWTIEAAEKKKRKRQASASNRSKKRRADVSERPPTSDEAPPLAVKQESPVGSSAPSPRAKPQLPTETAPNFETAVPTPTHMALVALADPRHGHKLKFVVTQNVDGLHARSGLPRHKFAALHGDVFTEKCATCKAEVIRAYDVGGVGLQPTGNRCEVAGCGGPLHDFVLDWDDALPADDLAASEQHIDEADLLLCLGTSLRIEPVGQLPLRAKRFVIVNLQVTPLDDAAAMVIRAKVDDIMVSLLESLRIPLPVPLKPR